MVSTCGLKGVTDGGEENREEEGDVDFVSVLSGMMDAVRTFCLSLHILICWFCFLLQSALKSEVLRVTLKAAFFLNAACILSAGKGLLPSKRELTIVFLWKKLCAVLVVMTAGGLIAFARVKQK